MTRFLLGCLLLIGFSLAQPLVQIYPDGRDFDTEYRTSAFSTTDRRIKLALDDLPPLSTEQVNSLSLSVNLPMNSLFEIGFSLKDDELQRQAVWRIERKSSGAEVSVCTPPDNGESDPACELNGGPFSISNFNAGFNDIYLEVEFLDETTIQATMTWNNGQTFRTTFYSFDGTDTFTLNMQAPSENNPIRIQNIIAAISGRLYIELANCPSEERVAAIFRERIGEGAVAYTESPECDITARFYGSLSTTTSKPFYRCNGREISDETETPTEYFDLALEGPGRYFVETCGDQTDVDTIIRTWSVPCSQLDGTNLGENLCLGRNDDRCADGGSLATINLETEGVQEVCVAVSSENGAEGNFQLTVALRDEATELLRENGVLDDTDSLVTPTIDDCGGADLTYLQNSLYDLHPLTLTAGTSYDYYLATTCRGRTEFNTTLTLFDSPCGSVDFGNATMCLHSVDDFGCRNQFDGASSFFFELGTLTEDRELCFVVSDSEPDVDTRKRYQLRVVGITVLEAPIPAAD